MEPNQSQQTTQPQLPSPRPPNFVQILDNVFREDAKKWVDYRKDAEYRHNPSSATAEIKGKVEGACLRQLYYKATKVTESDPQDPTNKYAAFMGDAVHFAIQRQLQKSREVSFMPETKGKVLVDGLTKEVSYRLDGLVSSNSQIGGLEIKTTQGEALHSKFYGIKVKGPKLDHLLQVITYFNSFPGLSWFVLFYIARDDGYKLQFDITRDGNKYKVFSLDGKDLSYLIEDVTFNSIVKRWATLEDRLKHKIIPKRDYRVWLKDDGTIQDTKQIKGEKFKSDWRCGYCSFKTKCWSEPDARENSYNAGATTGGTV